MLKILLVLTIFALLNGYIFLRVMARWPWAEQHMIAFWLIACLCFALQLMGPLGDRLLFPRLRHYEGLSLLFSTIDWLSYLSFGIFSSLFVYTLAADIITVIWQLAAPPQNSVDFNRRTLITLGAVTAGTTALGVAQASATPVVQRVDIPLVNLPSAFDGLTIAQISDLHIGPLIGRDYVATVVRIVNDLKPDVIALTGDFIDGSVADLRSEVAPLADLTAPLGKFFVTGNHEYYWGAAAWEQAYTQLGMTVLSNTHRLLRRGDAEIILAGVPDYSTLHQGGPDAMNPAQALQGAPADRVKILLAHQPASYRLAHAAGFDLQLSGHTHAGQYFPFNLFIGLFQRYYKGLNRHENMWVYVNRGTGYWGPPLRTGVPSEITLLTLRVAKA